MREDLWPGGIVPYELPPDLPCRRQVEQAIEQWNSSGVPVILVPREGQEDYVEFVAAQQCESSTGRVGGRQEIRLSPGCRVGVVLHELGHTAGMQHEHTRPDRDKYLTVRWENIYPDSLANFQIRPHHPAELAEYDFASIMHYSQMAFSRNRGTTIVPRPEFASSAVLIGQRRELSAGDIACLRRMYDRTERGGAPCAR